MACFGFVSLTKAITNHGKPQMMSTVPKIN
ncbi:MAG: hypothetical protein ACJASS_001727 [Sulfitobacter sp.]|jgi:hypothetical protein